MQRFDFEDSYILHHRPFQETSLLLEVFSKNHGRFSAVAKGARRPKARARGLLQPFVPLLLSCVGRSELLTLKDFDMAGPMHFLQGRALISALYINELLVRLMHRFDPHPELFEIYKTTLAELEKLERTPRTNTAATAEKKVETDIETETKLYGASEEITLRLFEKSILKAIGYELQLTTEALTHQPIVAEDTYIYDPERGPIWASGGRSSQTTRHSLGQVKLEDRLFKGKSLLALAADNFLDKATLMDAKRLMRQALKVHLGAKPIESRRLF